MVSDELSSDSDNASLSKSVCTLCRQRKTRCDRRLPRCGFCVKAKVDCHYTSTPQKRGLRAGYVTELESRIVSLEKSIEVLKSSKESEQLGPALIRPQTSVATASTYTPSTASVSTPGRFVWKYSISDANAAVADLMTLPQSYFCILADQWFKEEHDWLPILEYDQVQQSLSMLPQPVDHIPDIVLCAIISLKLGYSSQAISLGYKGRRRLSLHLRSQVLAEAMANPSLASIRALFVIALLDFGSDNIPSTLNIMSMCRRTGERIGIFQQLLQRIESQSPQHVGPPPRDIFINDSAQIAQTWAILCFDAVASLGVAWRDVTASLVDHLSGVAYISAPDFRDSFVTHVHLTAIGLQPVHEFFVAYANGKHQSLLDDTLKVTDNLYQNLIAYVRGLPKSGYTILADGAVDFDINHIFTRLVAHAAILMIYQRYVFDYQAHEVARERCEESYSEMIDLVRNISDADTELNTPIFSHLVAVAVRYRLILIRNTQGTREPLFDILMHSINMCGRRWPLARRIDIVLRAAVAEVDSGTSTGLPDLFWDPRKNEHDIGEDLKKWVHEFKPSLWIGVLNGPYA